ncbi:hypothetical protein CONPUDRAFT_62059 [Coniophora puteana RWD-64-598 SS2]|uniref:Uncharacterized protein n=1 Tax=Coniophora puteana (strain RWD-64-598) TaxID=741705 RepID=A0A5M3MGW8_CONPW|nr:uncharacterized protein CONPUDRAFT_62059 [Coniophora puteana RWD-64-598 SS2]EIW77875.1 hypothetical protein CONPUDRAFT_62059 [Coniophora puteana RWD-64-598 SS2]
MIIVDDHDDRVQYSEGWFTSGSYPEYLNTTHAAIGVGQTATLSFTGVSISVYGTLSGFGLGGIPTSQYVVDGAEPVSFTAPNISGASYHYQYFSSDLLEDGTHSLVVTNTNDGTFWLDFFEYLPSPSTF